MRTARSILSCALLLAGVALTLCVEGRSPVNYDVAKIPPYALEDPLAFADGTKLTSPADWPRRRQEILDIFAKEMYGQPPPAPEAVVADLVDVATNCAGFGVRRQYKMYFKADRTGPCVNWLVETPRFAKGPVPVILALNYRGNHELFTDEDIPVMQAWSRQNANTVNHRATAATRGQQQRTDNASVFPIGLILARGYAVATACYCEVSPDPTDKEEPPYNDPNFAYTGVFKLWGPRNPARTDNPTALGAWAWALSRGLDLCERLPEIDAAKAVVTGCSRLAKAALIAAVRDERFAVCVPNQTGGGGVPLAKRDFGENVATEMEMFPHWYCAAYGKYAKEPWKTLTFDQHLLVAAVAPRALLVQGFTGEWFDPEGEYLSCRAAAPVWAFLGKGTMPATGRPELFSTSAVGKDFGYVWRSQRHGISAHDWMWMLDFADGVLKR